MILTMTSSLLLDIGFSSTNPLEESVYQATEKGNRPSIESGQRSKRADKKTLLSHWSC